MELSIPARLLFIGLWNYACDNGHLQDKPKQIKMRILPGDDVNCTELLRELEDSGRILRASGVITIPNFGRHQKPDRRYFTTCTLTDCPEPDETVSQRESRRAHTGRTTSARRAHDVGTASAHVDGEVKGSEGDGEGESRGKPATRAAAIKDSWRPNQSHIDFCALNGLDPNGEGVQFRDHHRAKGSTMKDWDAAFRNWLRKAVEYGRGKPSLVVVADPTAPSSLPPVEDSWMRRRPQ